LNTKDILGAYGMVFHFLFDSFISKSSFLFSSVRN